MKRNECYAIGVRQLNAKGEDSGGYLAVNCNRSGKGRVLVAKTVKDVYNMQPALDIERGYIVIANTREDAEALVRWLSRAYRKSFREYAKKHNLSMDDFRFFMVKLSNPVFDDYVFVKLEDRFYGLDKMKYALYNTKGTESEFRGDKKNINLYEVKRKYEKANITIMMPR